MKKLFFLPFFMLFLAETPVNAQTFLGANLTAHQQTHSPTPDSASGTGAFILREEGLWYQISVEGLSGPIAAAHFHNAAIGVDGAVVHAITESFDGYTATGAWTFDDGLGDHLEALLLGNLYVNVHTAANAPGEIRGQVNLRAGSGLTAELTAAQQTHTVDPDTATGSAALTFTDAGLVFDITVEGLSGPIAAAHFHNAPAGQDGPVVFGIGDSFNGNTAAGVWPLDQGLDALESALFGGELYLNVHTPVNGPGEIRGQVNFPELTTFTANLNSQQQNHAVTPDTATGTGSFALSDSGLAFNITVEGLSGPIAAAHFHNAAIGQDGVVVHGIAADFDGNHASGFWALDDGLADLMPELLLGNLYVNVHTAANGPGEIRGQVELSSGIGFVASMSADQETHAVDPDTAKGTGSFTHTAFGMAFDITVEGLSGQIAASHFHNGPAGADGPVVKGITDDYSGNTAAGVWRADDGLENLFAELLNAELYVNVHTAANAPGEIRGQVENSLQVTSVETTSHDGQAPRQFALAQNFPNPFNPTTEIEFTIQKAGPAVLKIFNLLGQEIAVLVDENLTPGRHRVTFQVRNLPSGIYIYQLDAAGLKETRKMTILK